ncbi:unnamed protein product [Alopecurus aequalis]
MGALARHKGVIAALDKRCRAFLWTTSDRASGAQCLVAWNYVYGAKREGGLGVRSLAYQNTCLQVKLQHRLHDALSESWARWVWSALDGSPIDTVGRSTTICGSHWTTVTLLLPLYRAITTVKLGDGHRISFWLDSWTKFGALSVSMPKLHSHCTSPLATVRQVLDRGMRSLLVNRLSLTAARHLTVLEQTLASVEPSSSPDSRVLPLCASPDGKFRSSSLYLLCTSGGELFTHYAFIWDNGAPSKVKFFAWLLLQGRIQCRSNLHRKGILSKEESGCPICDANLEKLSTSPSTVCSLAVFGPHLAAEPARSVSDTPQCPLPPTAPTRSAATLQLLCLWHLWKHKNGVVFNGQTPSLATVRKNWWDHAVLWRGRPPPPEWCEDVDTWLTFFTP